MTEFDVPWQQPETEPAPITELFDESPFEITQFGAHEATEFSGQPAEFGVNDEALLPGACAQKVKALRVAVVGGGFAGLMAARTLCRQGAQATLFEARAEVGGRVLSDYGRFSRGRITEFGAELVGSIHTRWCQLAIEYGLALISRMNTELYRGQQLNVKLALDRPLTMDEIRSVDTDTEKVQRQIAALASGIGDPSQPWGRDNISDVDKKTYDNMSVAAALQNKFGVQRGGRVWKNFELLLANNNVAPLDSLNFLGLLCLVRGGQFGTIAQGPDRLMGYWNELEIYRCADGCQRLALKIKGEIAGRRHHPSGHQCEILVHRAVTDINLRKDGGIDVVSRKVSGHELVGAPIRGVYDYLILAIPPSVWGGVTIRPVHPKEPSQVGLMGMGDAIKFFSEVKTRFWIKDSAAPYGGALPLGQVWEGTDNQTQIGDQGIVLSVFAGGPTARQPESKFKSELTKLYRNYPPTARTHFANWPAEPFIKTGYASPGLGQVLTVGRLLTEPFKPFNGRLLFAGEHTQMGYFGYMEGALRSGERAAQQLLQHACDLPRGKPLPAPDTRLAEGPGDQIETDWEAEDFNAPEAFADDQHLVGEPTYGDHGETESSFAGPASVDEWPESEGVDEWSESEGVDEWSESEGGEGLVEPERLEAENQYPYPEFGPEADSFDEWLAAPVTSEDQVPGAAPKLPPAPYATMPLGVDFSDHQASCTRGRCTPLARSVFERLRRLGKVFAILKASQYQSEQTFPAHYQLAREVGLIRGAYHLFTEAAVEAQVRLFLGLVPRLAPGELPPSLDVEDPSSANMPLFRHYRYTHGGQGNAAGTTALLDALQQWLDRVEAALGRTPIIYTGAMWRDDLRSKRMSQYPLWTIPNRLPFGGWGSRADILQYAEDGERWLGQAKYREPGVGLPGVDYDSYNDTIYGLRGLADLGRVGVGLTPQGAIIAHSEVDRHIHLLREATPQAWTDADLMNGALPSSGGDPTLLAVGSAVAMYFRDDGGRVVEALQRAPSASWDVDDLSTVAGVTAMHDPRVLTVGSQRHVVFSGDDDDWHLLTRQATGGWTVSHLLSQARRSGFTSVPESSGQPVPYVVAGSPNPRIVGRAGPIGDLFELALGPNGWQATSLSGVVTGPTGSPPPATYSPAIYQTAAETFIVYRAVRGQLWHIARGARRATNLSDAATGSVAAVGHPTCFVHRGEPHILYRGVDRNIHDISLRAGSWGDHMLPCGVPAASDPTCTSDGSAALVAFRATNGMVRAARFDGSMWTCVDTVRSRPAGGGTRIESPGIPPRMAENAPADVPIMNFATPLDAPPSSEESEELPTSEEETSSKPLAHMAFKHILLESSTDPTGLTMVPGVVPATPAALTTPFYDAAVAGTTPDSTSGGLQEKLTNLLNGTPAYKKVGKNLAVALVDLSGANKFAPKYAGFNDLANFYGASVNKITGLLGVYQLLAEANELLRAQPTITDAAGLQSAFTTAWTQAGIQAPHHPLVAQILVVRPGSPPSAEIHPDLVARLDRISKGNQNGSTPIVLLKFPYIGSTLLAHGLYSPVNKGGLWTRKAYGAIKYRGQDFSLPNWSAKENPHPTSEVHNINAVSVVQFYTVAAQRRMIDGATSNAVLKHLQTGGCTTLIDVDALSASGQLATKCGIFPEGAAAQWVHNCVHFKETATLREFVVVILTKGGTWGIMKNLFKDLVALIP
jgi:monoamine oxidase